MVHQFHTERRREDSYDKCAVQTAERERARRRSVKKQRNLALSYIPLSFFFTLISAQKNQPLIRF